MFSDRSSDFIQQEWTWYNISESTFLYFGLNNLLLSTHYLSQKRNWCIWHQLCLSIEELKITQFTPCSDYNFLQLIKEFHGIQKLILDNNYVINNDLLSDKISAPVIDVFLISSITYHQLNLNFRLMALVGPSETLWLSSWH